MTNYKEFLYDWMGGNDVLFLAINGIHGEPYDTVMKKISWLGEHEHFPLYFTAIALFAVLSLLVKTIMRKRGKWYYTTGWLGVLLMMLAGYAATGTVTKELKSHFSYPRPYVALANTGKVYKLEATEKEDDFRSFPSGHVTFTTFMVIALAPLLSSFLTWCGVGLILLMGWSRISLGMHFPADVIGAVLIIAPIILLLRWVLYTLLRKLFKIKC